MSTVDQRLEQPADEMLGGAVKLAEVFRALGKESQARLVELYMGMIMEIVIWDNPIGIEPDDLKARLQSWRMT